MSETKHILTFTLRNELFAIDALVVKEIVYLPELTLEEEVPAFIAGAFNLRGKIVHVMDLNIRLGHAKQRYSLTDRVIVLEITGSAQTSYDATRNTRDERRLLGIIVNDVLDVIPISTQDIEEAPGHRFVAGEAKIGDEIIMVLDHKAIAEFGMRNSEVKEADSALHTPHSAFTPEELSLFHERALNLMKEAAPEVEGLVPLAVFSLNGEYYGASLEAIREFSDIRSVTPVPCTPPHIIGDMNLRGDILTLVDIRGLLNLPNAEFGTRNSELKEADSALRSPHSAFAGKAIVAQFNELLAGITVNEVFEVIYVKPSDIRPVPAAVEAASAEYMKGEVPYGGKMLSVLDLQMILTREELAVNG